MIVAKEQSAKEVLCIAIVPRTNRALRGGRVPRLSTNCEVHRTFLKQGSRSLRSTCRPFAKRSPSRASLILDACLWRYFHWVSKLAINRQRLGPITLIGARTNNGAIGISNVDKDDNLRVRRLRSEALPDMNIVLSSCVRWRWWCS